MTEGSRAWLVSVPNIRLLPGTFGVKMVRHLGNRPGSHFGLHAPNGCAD